MYSSKIHELCSWQFCNLGWDQYNLLFSSCFHVQKDGIIALWLHSLNQWNYPSLHVDEEGVTDEIEVIIE